MTDFEELLGGWGLRIDNSIRRVRMAWLQFQYSRGWKERPEPMTIEQMQRLINDAYSRHIDFITSSLHHTGVLTNVSEPLPDKDSADRA